MREYVLTEAERSALRRFFARGERTGELRVLENRIRQNLTSGRLPEDYKFIQQWLHAYCKGKIRSYVARSREPPKKVVKTMLTMVRKQALSPTEIKSILSEVEHETVSAFSNNEEVFAQRSSSLNGLRRLLVDESLS